MILFFNVKIHETKTVERIHFKMIWFGSIKGKGKGSGLRQLSLYASVLAYPMKPRLLILKDKEKFSK